MKLLGEIYPMDLALLPIGSVFVMDPLQAAWAVEMLKPRKVVPMHYKTFPILVQDAREFANLAKEKAPGVEVHVLEPGQSNRVLGEWERIFALERRRGLVLPNHVQRRAALYAMALKTVGNDIRRG
jgi:L-ascorbate metabolism protein UlaG (beta-lactamase superfamily)